MNRWRGREGAIERLAAHYVVDDAECWLWQGSVNRGGYGTMRFNGMRMNAHRAAYLLLVGPIADGLDLDHLCRVRRCVNPAHMEPVTRSENLRRGEVGGTHHRAKTHCPQGHPYDAANTYYRPDKPGRTCRICQNEARTRYNQRRKVSA